MYITSIAKGKVRNVTVTAVELDLSCAAASCHIAVCLPLVGMHIPFKSSFKQSHLLKTVCQPHSRIQNIQRYKITAPEHDLTIAAYNSTVLCLHVSLEL